MGRGRLPEHPQTRGRVEDGEDVCAMTVDVYERSTTLDGDGSSTIDRHGLKRMGRLGTVEESR
jgi:hypothetical protein